MREKLCSCSLIIMVCMVGIIFPVQGQQLTVTSHTSVSESTPTITISDIRLLLYEKLQHYPLNPQIRLILQHSIDEGMKDLETMGVSFKENILNPQKSSVEMPLKLLKRTHVMLLNFYPDVVNISLTLRPFVTNLSSNITGQNTTHTLEIFIKLIPVIDFVKTEQRIILRKVYQNTPLLWPSIGCRILEENTTVFIIAFGPGMQRSWKIF